MGGPDAVLTELGRTLVATPGVGRRGERAATWLRLAQVAAEHDSRGRALVAARTAHALDELTDSAPDRMAASLALIRTLTGPDVVPMQVAAVPLPGAGHDAAEGRAVWLGAPAAPVLAMLGWVERDGALEVVRVVAPGTRRGRDAFALLLAAMPVVVPVTLRLPARDPALRRRCERAGFAADDGAGVGAGGPSGYVGGTLRLHRPATG